MYKNNIKKCNCLKNSHLSLNFQNFSRLTLMLENINLSRYSEILIHPHIIKYHLTPSPTYNTDKHRIYVKS